MLHLHAELGKPDLAGYMIHFRLAQLLSRRSYHNGLLLLMVGQGHGMKMSPVGTISAAIRSLRADF
ncbi:hypothetical protein DPMN_114149 [Dreissena polymorpha]|uniref:Uncharacterized protein n=1 Tax=Dreissena polymorpha TaxID=45954 RepID=A0A9D4KJL8_DREPO|nr:hypothetical protein DPMN_114149 [Dreissena polymorpha]